ncbi:SAM-dependent methyltransferase [Weissella tructae]|uniref:SAM-dependent methyltransferase n=1 Tax=Weissella tructae TaxID=887702 RepID=UPI003D9149F6
MTKPVLDMTAGGRMMWQNKNNELALFVDKREETLEMMDRGNVRVYEVKPDVLADWSDVNGLPFESGEFHQIIFDPPHLVRAGKESWLRKKYGVLDKVTWTRDLERGFAEAARLLAKNGTLIFKWNSDQILLSEVLKLIPDELVATVRNRVNKTYMCVFIKQ